MCRLNKETKMRKSLLTPVENSGTSYKCFMSRDSGLKVKKLIKFANIVQSKSFELLKPET